MEYIQVNYKDLNTKQEQLYELVHGPKGLEACGVKIKNQMDVLAKAWKDKGHYEQLNVLGKELNDIHAYINTTEHYQILIRDVADEYKKACSECKTLASEITK